MQNPVGGESKPQLQ